MKKNRTDYISVKDMTDDWTIENFFTESYLPKVKSYDRTEVVGKSMNIIELVLSLAIKITDKKTKKEVPFNKKMLKGVRTLGERYNLELKELRWEPNRNDIWSESDVIKFLRGLIGNNVDASIVVYEVEKCLNKAKNVESPSESWWKEVYDLGFTMLCCDGTHKLYWISKLLLENNYFNSENPDKSNPMFHICENTEIFVRFKTTTHIDKWSENYLYSTYGVSPTQAAIRRGILGEINDEIKKTCKELDWLPESFPGIIIKNGEVPKHSDEDRITKLSYWWEKEEPPIETTNEDLTNYYISGRKISKKSKSSIKDVKKYLQIFYDNANPTKSRFTKNAWEMFIYTCKELKNRRIKIEDSQWKTVVDLFVEIWFTHYNDDTTIEILGETGQINKRTFRDFTAGLNGAWYDWFTGDFLDKIIQTIIDELNPIELDKKRDFDNRDRWNIIQNQVEDGKVKVRINNKINGKWYKPNLKDENDEIIEFEYISITEAFTNAKEYVCDHIKPHILGGKTIPENGELTSWDYNNWKDKKYEE